MAFVTFLDEACLDQVGGAKEAVAQGSQEPFAKSLAECFPDLAGAREAYRAGQPAYAGVGGGGALTGDYYGWAAVPPAYVKRVWGAAGFDAVEWVPSGTLFPQAMVGLIKRSGRSRFRRRVRRVHGWLARRSWY